MRFKEDNDNNDKELKDQQKLLIEKIEELVQSMEKYNIAEYIQLLNDPKKYFWVNFLAGVIRGLGIAVGMTILGAILIYFLQRLVVLNLPLIGDFIAEIVRIVQNHL
ncbi:DUF5665 domain-containing protein [Natranaerofaba carboxydovora]|uniref:DUF5665 domain-containing protein n=1 Tax=Natranaerofaba carboxydovora TaxID=2742683 RepID=UPI001F12F2B5|nr:DUF5665 domain-containing protein [Natranaerofaba carboxydovora]UMZ73283.1 hypothetical protein ACONDI_00836 [Natranaerofaba carboxydovora]